MPSERIVQGYTRLFELRLLHHYWLDNGANTYDARSESERIQHLLTYDVRKFLDVIPTASTLKTLQGIRAIFLRTSLGFVVVVPKEATLPLSTTFEFRVIVTSPDFYQYTALTLGKQSVIGLLQKASGRTFTFKENVAVFSNSTGVTRGPGPLPELFLSKEYPLPSTDHEIESFENNGGVLEQITSNQPNATSHVLATLAAVAPVFAHQGDVPVITDPTDMVGTVPSRGITLSDEIGPDTYAVIRIDATRADNAAFDCVTNLGTPRVPHPIYQIRFKNRSTTWRYIDLRNPNVVPVTRGPFPLTFHGNATAPPNAPLVQKPPLGTVKIVTNSNGVDTLVSDVFI